MKSNYLQFILFIVWNFSSSYIFSQPNSNIGFEQGSLTEWEFKTNGNLVSAPIKGRIELTSGNGLDPYGGFPVVAPNGGNHSLKLGNSSAGAEFEEAIYSVKVPNGSKSLTISYCIVLEDGGHAPNVQPKFQVSATDSSTGKKLNCSSWNFIVGSTLGFQTSRFNSDVVYRSWSDITLDLSSFQGKTIIITFATSDCSAGGHFGYAYIDLAMQNYDINGFGCRDSNFITVSAPPGFKNYTWWSDSLSEKIGSEQNVKLSNGGNKKIVIVTMEPFDGFGCADTLVKEILVSDLTIVNFPKDTTVCKFEKVNLSPQIICGNTYKPLKYSWVNSSSGNFSCSNCFNTTFNSDSVSSISEFVVKDAIGCILNKSISISIYHESKITKQPMPIDACEKTKCSLSILAEGPGILRYQWYKDKLPVLNGVKNHLDFNYLSASDNGEYYCTVYTLCDSVVSQIININVKIRLSVNFPFNDLKICEKDPLNLNAKLHGNGPFVAKWYRGNNLIIASDSSYFIANISHIDSGFYRFYASGQCNDTFTPFIKIKVLYKPQAHFIVNANPQCEKNQFIVFNNKSLIVEGKLSYTWKLDSIYSTSNLSRKNLPVGHNLVRLIALSEYGCIDSIEIDMVINETPKVKILINDSNQCNPSNFKISDNTSTNNGNANPIWKLDGEIINRSNFERTKKTGIYRLTLISTTEKGCNDSMSMILNVWEQPLAKYIVSDTAVCLNNQKLQFLDNTISNNQKITDITWDFGNGENSNLPTLNFKYSKYGLYKGLHRVINEKGCRDSNFFNIRIYPSPVSNFSILSEDTAINPVFFNHSYGAEMYKWDFGNGVFINTNNLLPIADFAYDHKKPFYDVSLFAINEFGCMDDTIQRYYTPTPIVYIPNAFSPNNVDGRNDNLHISCKKCLEYQFEIYNQWGEHIYSSQEIKSRFPIWNGKHSNGRLQNGTFLLIYSYKDLSGHQFNGKQTIYVLD